MAIINLTPVFDAFTRCLAQVYAFSQNVLVFQVHGYSFNMLNWSLGVYFAYNAIGFFFGYPFDWGDTVYEDPMDDYE